MSLAHFKVGVGSVSRRGWMSIDRESGMVSLRVAGTRQRYELHLSDVAEMIFWRVTKEIARQTALERKLRRSSP